MVMEDAKVTRAALESDPTDEYWETRYTLRDETTIAKRERQRQLGLDLDAEIEDEEENPRGFLTGGAKIPSFLEPWKHKILLPASTSMSFASAVSRCPPIQMLHSLTRPAANSELAGRRGPSLWS